MSPDDKVVRMYCLNVGKQKNICIIRNPTKKTWPLLAFFSLLKLFLHLLLIIYLPFCCYDHLLLPLSLFTRLLNTIFKLCINVSSHGRPISSGVRCCCFHYSKMLRNASCINVQRMYNYQVEWFEYF